MSHIMLFEVINTGAEHLPIIVLNLIISQQMIGVLLERHVLSLLLVAFLRGVLQRLAIVVLLIRLVKAEIIWVSVNFSSPFVDALVNFHAKDLLLLLVFVDDSAHIIILPSLV